MANNALQIINKYKRLYRKTHANIFAQKVERITGEYPDSMLYQSPSDYRPEGNTEMQNIEESINNPELANIPF